MIRKSCRTPTLALALALLGGLSCAETEAGKAPQLGELYFPTGVALTPAEGGARQLLLVANANADLRFRAGTLQAFDVETLDRAVAEAPPPAGCAPETPRCRPLRIPDLSGAFVAGAEISDFSGSIAVATLPGGGLRAFVPTRSNDKVVAVDVDPAAGTLTCAEGGGTDCRGTGPDFPRQEPFSVVTALGNVYIGHVDITGHTNGVVGAATVDAPLWTGGEGELQTVSLRKVAAGGLAVGGCRDTADGPTCTLYVSGRSLVENLNPVFLFDFRAGVLEAGPLFTRNVFAQERGFDARGVAVSASGNLMYMASRAPAAIATIDVSRRVVPPSNGCVLLPGQALPEGCPTEPAPLDGEAEPAFVTANLVTTPPEPNTLVAIPRQAPGAAPDELLVVTTNSGIGFYDPRAGTLAGFLQNLGPAPSAIAFKPFGTGVRLYVPSYGRGTLAIVDVPDLFRPADAQLVAVLGAVQEGGL